MTTPAEVIATAKSFAAKGYKEANADDTLFGKWYGMNHAAWCAMFVSYCFGQNGGSALVAASTPKGFASCHAATEWFKKNKSFFHTLEAKPGDVVFMAFDGDLSDADHVGIVVSNDTKKKILHTIEGNTTDPKKAGSQAQGDGVYEKARPYSLIVGIGRPKWPATTAQAVVETPKPVKAPVAAPTKIVAPTAVPAGKLYTVVAGDSYWAIAEKHPLNGMATSETTRVFQKLNGNKPLHPGDKITIK